MTSRALPAFAVAVALLATACGGSGGDSAPGMPLGVSTTAAAPPAFETPSGTDSGVPTGTAEFAAGFGSWVRAQIDDAGVPGASVVIVGRDEVLLVEGIGVRDVAAGAPVTGNTLFHIGSTHKAFTSLLVATLVDDGLLDWDTPLVDIDLAFELSDPEATAEVTMRDLLTMTSGIPDSAEDDLDFPNATSDDVFEVAATSDLIGRPGAEFSYSNVAYALAGYLAVIAAGGSGGDHVDAYADLLTRRVLEPIGMADATVFFSRAQASTDVSRSYEVDGGSAREMRRDDRDGDPLAPSGSLKAGAREMGLFLQTQLRRGVAPGGQRVVSEENLAVTWEPRLEGYAMGWEELAIGDVTLLAHEGAFDGFMSIIAIIPEFDLGFAILANSEAADDLLAGAPAAFVEAVSAQG